MTDLSQSFGKEKMPSVINAPFKKTSIEAVHVFLTKNIFTKEFQCTGSVEFKNGNTQGKQTFKAQTFDEVVLQIKAFFETLES